MQLNEKTLLVKLSYSKNIDQSLRHEGHLLAWLPVKTAAFPDDSGQRQKKADTLERLSDYSVLLFD
jgi:hypothetical protein